MKRLIYTLCLMMLTFMAQAQGDPTVSQAQQATGLRADNKIWVVMVVCLTILAGLILYVISVDRKLSRLEKK